MDDHEELDGIAVVGMSGRFPKASNLEEFWHNLVNGIECVSFPTDEELLAAGIHPADLKAPNYVKAGCFLEDADKFDAAFFGISPREAEMMDPQHRAFLETAWSAMEDAGYDTSDYAGEIGVFAGCSISSYLLYNLGSAMGRSQSLPVIVGNDKDYLATRVSYKLNLKGPSVVVQSACSTSLVAICLACEALLDLQCDMAIAGGVTIRSPLKMGYFYEQGSILSPDGHCRAFDAKAQGTVFSSGVGAVVLKRLADASRDRDTIHAVILGSAINNDGSVKIGYTAPGVDGQSRVIAMAHAMAGISPETITYVEAHGTGTVLGDPIEVTALTQAFRAGTQKRQYCGLGSVKTNIGHADTAAGVAGFIKTVQALKHRLIPPSLNFESPNPNIDFEGSPFFVNCQLREWTSAGGPRRAGVSAFGIGGTNAHVVLEEAPATQAPAPSRDHKLLVLSARSQSALEQITDNLAAHLAAHPELELADAAHTLAVGRRALSQRRFTVCRTTNEAVERLRSRDAKHVFSRKGEPGEPDVAFMFTGQGAQYAGMGRELYETETVFREAVDICAVTLEPHLGLDIRALMYPSGERIEQAATELYQTAITQPALFVIEYATAQLWMSWGVKPQVMIGHSIGEYVAACLAGVFTLADALSLVAARGRMMQDLPGGSMLAVSLAEDRLRPLLGAELALAAVNAPSLSVVSGPMPAVAGLQERLSAAGLEGRPLHTSHAFHSPMMDAILGPFTERVRAANPRAPQLPFVSNVTGTWITEAEATEPEYWARHLRNTVRFADGLATLFQAPERVFLEVGPGRTLQTFARRHPGKGAQHTVLGSMRHPEDQLSDQEFILTTLGKLWLEGVAVDWRAFRAGEARRRVPLPTYPFERQRFWLENVKSEAVETTPVANRAARKLDFADWFYAPSWKRADLHCEAARLEGAKVLVFADRCGVAGPLAARLESAGAAVVVVAAGDAFARTGDSTYSLNPRSASDYDALLADLASSSAWPTAIVHMWNVTGEQQPGLDAAAVAAAQYLGFYSLLFLAQAIGRSGLSEPLRIVACSDHLMDVTGEEQIQPAKATMLGIAKVMPQEYPNVTCRSVDVSAVSPERAARQILAELTDGTHSDCVAYRGNHRWEQTIEPLHMEQSASNAAGLRDRGVYLITGGTGGIGLTLAEHLARTVQAKLVLTARTAVPEREVWDSWLADHDRDDPTSLKIARLLQLEAAGAEVMVIAADVSDYEAMTQAVAAARQRFGCINGVIHSAGLPSGGVIQRKTVEQAEQILAPKLAGTLVLHRIFADQELDFMVLCSSITSIVGGFGQVDYCAANAFLDAYARSEAAAGRYTLSINWDAWKEVGMAAATGRTPAAERREESRNVAHPFFERCVFHGQRRAVYLSTFSPETQWVLSDHIIGGTPTLPGTGYMELARAAFADWTGVSQVELREVCFLAPLAVAAGQSREVRVVLEGDAATATFEIASRAAGGDWQQHARGTARRAPEGEPEVFDLKEVEARCQAEDVAISRDQRVRHYEFLEFGPRWDNLHRLQFGGDCGLASLELPAEFAADTEVYKLHPALLDAATGFLLARTAEPGPFLPFSYGSLTIRDSIPARSFSYARFSDGKNAAGTVHLDVSIMDEGGREVVAIRDYILRMVEVRGSEIAPTRTSDHQAAAGETRALPEANYWLDVARPGILESLVLRPAPRLAPGPLEVGIEVAATGLNFKEVLIALGMMQMPSGGPNGFGLECSGRITAVGDGVTEFQVGDRVYSLARPTFSPYVTGSVAYTAHIPDSMSFEDAATIPVAMLTAYFSLVTMGRLKRGEKVLIHAAAGGVGLAAVQVAQWLGAEIYATAGNEEKREYLRSLGIEHVMDSRSLSFADEVMKRTAGRGVDAVLNSLGGEFIHKGLEVLAPFGRFLEIGKRDIIGNTQLGLRPFEKGLTFYAIDIGPRDTADMRGAFQELAVHVADGTLGPIRKTVFPIDEAAAAFELMSRARHIGKIVVSLEKEPLRRMIAASAGERRDESSVSALGGRAGRSAVSSLTGSAASPSMSDRYRKGLVAEGLQPAEGAEAFMRLLGKPLSQVAITPRDLIGLVSRGPMLQGAELAVADREAAPQPAYARPEIGTEFTAPGSETEVIIAGVWRQVLGIAEVGIYDDFYELGGDSLLATQVVARLREAFQMEIAVAKMFEEPTIAGLAAFIEETRWSAMGEADVEGERDEGRI